MIQEVAFSKQKLINSVKKIKIEVKVEYDAS
jgi:hypothetical protein